MAKPTAKEIAAQTAVLSIERRIPSFSRKVSSQDIVDVNDEVDRQMVHVSKDLIDKKLLKEINRLDADMRTYLEARASQCSMLARGMWLFSLALINEVDRVVTSWIEQRRALARALAQDKYPEAIQQAERRLGKHFNRADYLSPDELEAAFSVRAKWLSLNVPAALDEINSEIAEREKARLAQEWESAGREMIAAMRESFAGVVAHMADRLGTDDESGKPRKFKDSTVAQMLEFLELFPMRNVGGDTEIEPLIRQAQALLKGKSAVDLRTDESARAKVREGMERITAKLSAMDVVAPGARKFSGKGKA